MIVYTHYMKLPDSSDGNGIRWRTLLQFGESWDIKGTVVMMNPGSANYKYPDNRNISSPATLEHLKNFDDGDLPEPLKVPDAENWYEFNSDPTLNLVAKLFEAYYTERGETLKGIIQIFNIFYLREADLPKALEMAERFALPSLTEYDIEHLVKPIYLGFGGLANNKDFRDVCKRFYDVAVKKGVAYLQKDFDKQKFYHPGYLLGRGKNRPQSIRLRYSFLQDTDSPEIPETILASNKAVKLKLDNVQIMNMVIDKLVKLRCVDKQNHRFELTSLLELTVTSKEGGFVGVRHLPLGKIYNQYSPVNTSTPNESAYREVLEEAGFDTTLKSSKVWLGRKSFSKFKGEDEKAVAQDILDTIRHLYTVLLNVGKC